MCNEQKKPHVHAALIKAWADGAIIQYQRPDGCWVRAFKNEPDWGDPDVVYRIKPEPKPDLIEYATIEAVERSACFLHPHDYPPNIKFTFDGETGKLKKVEFIG
jgi:hypothetical protein